MRNLLKILLRTVATLLFRVRVSGALPTETQRLLVVANHESFLDGLLLGLFLPLDPVFVVHTGVVRNPVFRLLLGLVDYLAVDPTSPMAMKRVIRLIEGGRPVVIFPEGRITTTGSLMKTYDGPAFVAAKTGAIILPVRIDGAARTYFSRLAAHMPRKLFPQIGLFLQPTTRIAMPEAGSARDRRRKAGDAMRRLMQEMIFASRPQQTLFEALLDAAAIGLSVTAFAQVILERHGPPQSDAFENAAAALPEVTECYSLSGDADYFLRLVAPDLQAFSELMMKRVLCLPGIANVKTDIVLGRVKQTHVLPLDHITQPSQPRQRVRFSGG